MHVKALKTFIGREGSVRRGAVFETDPRRGRELERRGLAVALLTAPETQPVATMLQTFAPHIGAAGAPEVAEAGTENPTLPESSQAASSLPASEPPTGGPIGEAAEQSLSPPAPRPRRSRSRKRATPEPDFLP